MKIFNNFDINNNSYSVVTIGNFDGIHTGHKKLIETTIDIAKKNEYNAVVLTFSPHPIKVMKDSNFACILSEEEKNIEIGKYDIDFLIKYPFTSNFSDTPPSVFIEKLINELKCKVIIVGEDYCFGKNREGNTELLRKICLEKDVKFIAVETIKQNGSKIGSSIIRSEILNKNMKVVTDMLGKKYYISGEVCEGNMLGRTIGFPTANLITSENKILPPDGVYVTQTIHNNKTYNSITNIGKNPTVDNSVRTTETFIFDFNKSIYGDTIYVLFDEFIRRTKKFNSLDELKQQIEKDQKIAMRS